MRPTSALCEKIKNIAKKRCTWLKSYSKKVDYPKLHFVLMKKGLSTSNNKKFPTYLFLIKSKKAQPLLPL
jgi:hypothetical protein